MTAKASHELISTTKITTKGLRLLFQSSNLECDRVSYVS